MRLFSFTCPQCGGTTATRGEAMAGLHQVICGSCASPMVRPYPWRCPRCRCRDYHWWLDGSGESRFAVACARCGHHHSDADQRRESLIPTAVTLVVLAGAMADRYLLQPRLDATVLFGVRALLIALAAVLAYLLVLRRWSFVPDLLERRGPPAKAANRADRGRPIAVKSLEEEYRYIQFHPFSCACGNPGHHEVESHGVEIRPAWLARWLGGQLLPVFHLYDLVAIRCSECRGTYSYRFDIESLTHVSRGFRRRFLGDPMSLLGTHMNLVMQFQKGQEGKSSYGLRF